MHELAARVASANKTFSVLEHGWDTTNFCRPQDFEDLETGIQRDPHVVGDELWALLSHTNGHGRQPVPANGSCINT